MVGSCIPGRHVLHQTAASLQSTASLGQHVLARKLHSSCGIRSIICLHARRMVPTKSSQILDPSSAAYNVSVQPLKAVQPAVQHRLHQSLGHRSQVQCCRGTLKAVEQVTP